MITRGNWTFPVIVAVTFVLSLLCPMDLTSQTLTQGAPTDSTKTCCVWSGGVPFGPHKLPNELFGKLFTGTKLTFYPDSIVSTLTEIRASGMRVFLILVGPQHYYQNPDRTFNLDMWKARVDMFRDIDFSEFIEDGTIIAHQLVSEAKAKNQWGGTIIPNDVLDEMARYSKERWPTMATVLRADPGDLEQDAAGHRTPWPGGWQWTYLDAAWARFVADKAPVVKFAADEQASADRQNLALVVGLNVLTGGDGSSGIPGPVKGRWVMSPDELRLYGSTLLSQTKACAFGMWRYETPGSEYEDFYYFRRADINAAMVQLAALAAQAPEHSCSRILPGKMEPPQNLHLRTFASLLGARP